MFFALSANVSDEKQRKLKQSHQNPGMAGIYFLFFCALLNGDRASRAAKVRDPLIRANHRERFVGRVHVNTESHICTFITPLN